MKYSLVLALLLGFSTVLAAEEPANEVPSEHMMEVVSIPMTTDNSCGCSTNIMPHDNGCVCDDKLLNVNKTMVVSVIGQGVAPMNTDSPAQAYALAKRAAIADGYRLIAEKVKGVRVDGRDLIKNMMVKRTTVRTAVQAMVRNANVVETSFKDGLCEVEMEIVISYAQFI